MRHSAIWAVSMIVLLSLGCAVPDYHTPAGFSSTYHRRLFADRQAMIAAKPPIEQGTQREPQAGVFYPVSIDYRPIDRAENTPPTDGGSWTAAEDSVTPY